MGAVLTIPATANFIDLLAEKLLADAGGDPLALARARVFLPTQRSVWALQEALVRRGGAVLMPAIHPLGDLDDSDDEEEENTGIAARAAIPPRIEPLERHLLLAELVRRWRRAEPDTRDTAPTPVVGTLRLAAALARLLDEMQIARLDYSAFDTLVPDELAEHWQQTLQFLSIVIEHWPQILAARGLVDPIDRRNGLLERLAAEWRAIPPNTPVIAAGSTGSVPATADLLAVIAELPHGCVVLPGLDTDMDAKSWAALTETHPQFGLKLLLERLGLDRHAVASWPGTNIGPRAALAREIMRPDATAEKWRVVSHINAGSIAGLQRAECPDEQAEAEAIAVAIRIALEAPQRTVALVTPDRRLVRRVRAELRRWDIEVDESAGQPMSDTPPGIFLRLVIEAAAENLAPVPLLAMLKHRLCTGGRPSAAFRRNVRAFERTCLRGPRPAPGADGLRQALASAQSRPDRDEFKEELSAWLEKLLAAMAPLTQLLGKDDTPLNQLIAAHLHAAEALSADENGAIGLWRGEAGARCRSWVEEFGKAAESVLETEPLGTRGSDYPAIVTDILKRRPFRSRRQNHPRVAIWGVLEARLLRADLLILGGLNEGSWPGNAAVDPWLSRPMRQQIGLPAPERMTGLAAHDFTQLFQAPNVLLTRAVRLEGTPSVPSRWLTRLDAVLEGAGLTLAAPEFVGWVQELDRPDKPPRPAPMPQPRPPINARPRRLSVTGIETWMRDPYAIYARQILRLRRMEDVDADITQADYGAAVHDALHRFLQETPGELPADALPGLLRIGREELSRAQNSPGLWVFWEPRFRRVAEWFVKEEHRRRAAGIIAATEVEGELAFDAPGGEFCLIARADRIDMTPDGVVIIDYKTGKPPGKREVEAGFAPQLPLEGAILAAGGFSDFAAVAPAKLQYWHLSGRGDPVAKIISPSSVPASELAEQALIGVRGLIARYDDEKTPYPPRPAPAYAPRYSDYEHLARVAEWGAAQSEDT